MKFTRPLKKNIILISYLLEVIFQEEYFTSYIKTELDIDSIYKIYFDYYKDYPFTVVSNEEIHLKQVINTTKCLIHLKKVEGKLLITSIIDNLIKGASGQAIQNMNLMFGLDETTGLKLKVLFF